MYERLLVAVDHSEISERVLAAARDLAQLSGGEVRVVHVRERESLGRGGTMEVETTGEAQSTLDTAVAKLSAAGVRASGEMRHTIYGYAAREIVDSAAACNADTIVMGSKGRGDLAGLLLGSTAHKVIHLAHVPVLVVR
jgi:nucleotide-binding universal stress UspA family protein